MSVAGPVARAQGAITAFQHALGEAVSFAAEQSERAELAEARVRELEAVVDEAAAIRRERAAYRRGYDTGYKAARRGDDRGASSALAHRANGFSVVA